MAGKLETGKPVNESQLAAQLKVSRTPSREALLQLEQEGFIRSDERRGFSIERFSAREIREIYPMIWTLEGLVLRTSAACAHLLVPELTRINLEFARARTHSGRLSWIRGGMSSSRANHRIDVCSKQFQLCVLAYGVTRWFTGPILDSFQNPSLSTTRSSMT